MQNSNSLLYHKHILSDIKRLDERKNKFAYLRNQFLIKHCSPIQNAIDQIKKQIDKLRQIQSNQVQFIEEQTQIVELKQQIKEYEKTQFYFQTHIKQYQIAIKSLQKTKTNNLQKIKAIKNSLIKDIKNEGVYINLPPLAKKTLSNISTLNKSARINPEQTFIKNTLPRIASTINSQLNNDSIKKQILNRNRSMNINFNCSEPQDEKQKNNSYVNKNAIRNQITKFNNMETLFKECFQLKKNIVQKDVSLLKSKLIKNREEFMKICEIIGTKQGKASYEQFKRLSNEQIMTLFISFSWLDRKLTYQFLQKRKKIIQLIGVLPKELY